MSLIFEAAYLVGLVPLLWLAVLRAGGRDIGLAWWWIAGAFAVSFAADSVSRFQPADVRWLVSLVYPISQAALIGAVLLDRYGAAQLTAGLMFAGVASTLWHGTEGPDVLLRTVAWGAVAGLVVDRPALGRLRTALLVSFALGLVAWWGYAASPGWWTWGVFQGVRLVGILLFCGAAFSPVPRLSLERLPLARGVY